MSPGRARRSSRQGGNARLTGAVLLAALAVSTGDCQLASGTQRNTGPFTFVYGLERGGGFPAMRDLGLNTLYLDLLPSDLADLTRCRELIRAARQEGWHVIIGLPTTQAVAGRVSPCDETYLGSVREIITYCVSQLGNEPGVTAWATGHFLERALRYTDEDFRSYLRLGYPSLEALNASWGANLPTWMQITMDSARQLDGNQPHGVGRAAVDLADYQAWGFREVMAQWLRALRALDPDRPVLTGRLGLYRSLLSVPDGYDVVCVSVPLDGLESDTYTHNVQALDIARRGGKFRVLQVLSPPDRSTDAYLTDLFREWVQMAALHGSVGVAVEDWDLLADTYELEKRMPMGRRLLTDALRATRDMPFGDQPTPNAAVLYEPYAAGTEVDSQPTYGYLRGFLLGEPSDLIHSLRLGTRHGLVDFLALADLTEADLTRYGVILAPACLRLPPRQAERLASYVRDGGAVMADLGLGMYETGSWIALPDPWTAVFGLRGLGNLADKAGDLRVGAPVPGLPSLTRGMVSRGTFQSARREGTAPATSRHSYAVAGSVAEAQVTAGAIAFAPLAVRLDEQKQPIFAGLFANHFGAGLGVFATHSLWQYWPLDDDLSQALHGDLFARRARFALAQPGLLQRQLHFSAGRDTGLLVNRGRHPLAAELLSYSAEGRACQGGVAQFTPAPTELGLPSGTTRLVVFVPGRGMARFVQRPLVIQPVSGDACASLEEYGPTGVKVTVAGAGARVRMRGNRRLVIEPSGSSQVRMVLRNGDYPVAPGSRHTVTVTPRRGREQTEVLTASSRRELDLSGTYQLDTLTIQPAP